MRIDSLRKLLLSLSLTAICATANAQPALSSDKETTTIIRTVLDSLYRTNGESPTTVLLFDSLIRPITLTRVGGQLLLGNKLAIDPATLADFVARALPFIPYEARSWPATPYPKGFKYPRAVFKSIPWLDSVSRAAPRTKTIGTTDSSWASMASQYPGAAGITAMSVPGFNQDTTESIIWVRHLCGIFCNSDEVFLLRKSFRTWRIVERIRNSGTERHAIGSLRYLGRDGRLVAQAKRDAKARADSIALDRVPRRIRGTVFSDQTGLPIPRVRIRVYRNSPDGLDSTFVITADEKGWFEYRNPPIVGMFMLAQCAQRDRPNSVLGVITTPVHAAMDTVADIHAPNISPCWDRRAHPLESGELSATRFAASESPSSTEAEIYAAVLRDTSFVRVGLEHVLVDAVTNAWCGSICASQFDDELVDSAMLLRYQQNVGARKTLNPQRMMAIGVTLLGPDERRYLEVEGAKLEETGKVQAGAGFMTAVRAGHPEARLVLTISNIVFSSDSRRAMVEVERGIPFDDSKVFLLENSAGWKVIQVH